MRCGEQGARGNVTGRGTGNAGNSRFLSSTAGLWVFLLWGLHTVGLYFWLAANRFAEGWDRPKHLVSTLIFNDILQPVDVVTLFRVFSLNIGYYPPLYPLSVVPLYRLFGVSADVAGMVNAFYLLVLLGSLYGIGRRLYGTAVGLLSAFLGSMSPFLFAMLHYTYIDYALTALIALAVYLLLWTEGFRRPWRSVLFGLAMGAAMLTKWTPVVFVAGPFLLELLRSPVPADAARMRLSRLPWRELAAGAVGGVLLTWLWYAPNKDQADALLLGGWLPVLSVALVGAFIFTLLLPARPAVNVLKALSTGALVTSLWYLPRADMFQDIFSIVAGGRADRPDFLDPAAYLYYPKRLIEQGFGWPLFGVFAVLLVLAAHGWLRSRRPLGWQAQFLLLWCLVPAVVATLSTHREVRSVLPLMAPLIVAFARLLLGIRPPAVRRAAVGAVLAFLTVQFAVLNLSALSGIAQAAVLNLPGPLQVRLFAHGEHIQGANVGAHDERYWIVPDVLQTISARRGSDGAAAQEVRLGLLVNSRYLNEYSLGYVARTEYPHIVIENLNRHRDLLPGYVRLFGNDYLLMRSDPDGSEPAAVVETILAAPPLFFTENFALVKTYRWPDGHTLYLFENQTHRIPDRFGARYLQPPIEHVVEEDLGGKLRLLGYNMDVGRVAAHGELLVTLYWLALEPMEDDYAMHLKLLNGVRHVWGEQRGRPRWDAGLTSKWRPGQVVEDIRTVPIWPGTPPGSYLVEVLAWGLREDRPLEPSGGNLLLGPVDIPAPPRPAPERLDMGQVVGLDLGHRFRLLGYTVESGLQPGAGIHLTLFWQALSQVDRDYVVFNHLVGEDGRLWAQKDNAPVDGYYPTSKWEPGEVVRDRYDIVIPVDTPAQEYTIRTGMFWPESGERLPVFDGGAEPVDDAITLTRFTIPEH